MQYVKQHNIEHSSVFSSEIVAISIKACLYARKQQGKLTICTDSLSTINSVLNSSDNLNKKNQIKKVIRHHEEMNREYKYISTPTWFQIVNKERLPQFLQFKTSATQSCSYINFEWVHIQSKFDTILQLCYCYAGNITPYFKSMFFVI